MWEFIYAIVDTKYLNLIEDADDLDEAFNTLERRISIYLENLGLEIRKTYYKYIEVITNFKNKMPIWISM